MRALYHFKRVAREKGLNVKTLTEVQNRFTTKDMKESKDEALDPAPKVGDITQAIIAFDNPSSSILRVLRALRGEFSLASVVCEQVLKVTRYSKRQGTK